MILHFQQATEDIATGGQPSEKGFAWLREMGYKAVINLSPESTKNYLSAEHDIVKELGMDYVHYPIDCSTLHPGQYEQFSSFLSSFSGSRVFVHCGMNIKSSGFVHIYRVRELKENPVHAIESIRELNHHEEKWFDYFEKMEAMPRPEALAS